jgi:hypothetical protein
MDPAWALLKFNLEQSLSSVVKELKTFEVEVPVIANAAANCRQVRLRFKFTSPAPSPPLRSPTTTARASFGTRRSSPE